jgi:hypothetical protein
VRGCYRTRPVAWLARLALSSCGRRDHGVEGIAGMAEQPQRRGARAAVPRVALVSTRRSINFEDERSFRGSDEQKFGAK